MKAVVAVLVLSAAEHVRAGFDIRALRRRVGRLADRVQRLERNRGAS